MSTEAAPVSDAPPPPPRGTGAAALVATGILASRILGLVRQRVFATYLSTSDAADAFSAAFRIPNLLQNLFGEGALSASFIPVYSSLLARGDEREAGRVAAATFAALALITSVIVLAGVLLAPALVTLLAPGFEGAKHDLTVHLVRILYPGAGLLVLSAWCLGVLNSHRRFLLSYSAPVLWNVAMIAALLWLGPTRPQPSLAIALAWASVIGSALQFLVQLPLVLRLARHLRVAGAGTSTSVRSIGRNFVPALMGRGVVQISAYIDQILASWLPTGAVSALVYSQVLYTLPVSLFGMSVSAAELPTMSTLAGDAESVAKLRARLDAGLRRIAFFIVPSIVAFVLLGDVVVAAVYEEGRFTRADTLYVWGILAGASIGLLATTLARLYSSAYYAFQDTRTPLRYAVVRVVSSIALGVPLAFVAPPLLGIPARWGAAGLTIATGIAGWVELWLLRRPLERRIGHTGVPAGLLARLWAAALGAAALGWAVRPALPAGRPIVSAIVVLGAYGIVYFGATTALRIPEAQALTARVRRLGRR